jgi:glycosyltransferase involved in cell wall biosynthesis
MASDESILVGYVVKRYPRYSETFIVNEILAHEAAGLNIEIFALYPPEDTHFQDIISMVRAPVNYIKRHGVKIDDMWQVFKEAAEMHPDFFNRLSNLEATDTRDIYQAAVLARDVIIKGITHIHAHFGTSATEVARIASHLTSVPYSFTAHAKDIFHEEVEPLDLRRKLKEAADVITVSDYNVEYLRANYDSDTGRVHRVYNGMNLNRFLFKSPQDRPPRIINVGRLVEKKGLDVLIDACGVLASENYPFACQIIGTGELESELRAQIERLQLQKWVQLSGPRPQREVIGLLQDAALFAAPCVVSKDGNRDGLPTVLLESMALGTPCVSTDVTGIPEVLRHMETGLMVPQHDPQALALAMKQLMEDSALRVELATRARRLIEKEFDIHRNAARIREIFGVANV